MKPPIAMAAPSLGTNNALPSSLRLSIIICTRNRANLLREAIRSLLAQGFDRAHYEIVVVDNGSTDHTLDTVREFEVESPNVKYFSCPERSLPRARVCGASNAQAPVIGYLDDDARACPGWLARADSIVTTHHPVCFGGPFFARYDTPKPIWFRDEYGSVTHGASARFLKEDEFHCGGNIFFRRAALAAAGGFDPDFSKSTDAFTYGEETMPQIRLRRTFPRELFFYDPDLFILHLVRPERMTVARGVREAFEMGRGYGKLILSGRTETRRTPFLRRMASCCGRFLLTSLLRTPFRDRRIYPYWQNYIYEQTAKELRSAGMHYEHYLSAKRHRTAAQQRHSVA